MWINYQFMAVCPLILNFLHISSQKWLVFANYFSLPNFLSQLANFFTRIYLSYPWHFATMVVPAGADIRCRTKEKPGLSQSNIQSWPGPFQHHINFLYPRKKNPPLQLQIFVTYHAEYRSMQGHPVVLDVDLIADSEQHQRRCPSFQKPRYLGGHRKI